MPICSSCSRLPPSTSCLRTFQAAPLACSTCLHARCAVWGSAKAVDQHRGMQYTDRMKQDRRLADFWQQMLSGRCSLQDEVGEGDEPGQRAAARAGVAHARVHQRCWHKGVHAAAAKGVDNQRHARDQAEYVAACRFRCS